MKLRDFLHAPYTTEQLDSEVTLTPPVVVPPPVDCVLSAWSAWGPHPTDPALEIRTRTIVTPPANGGAPCGPLTETRPKPATGLLIAYGSNIAGHNYTAGGPDMIDVSKIPAPIPWTTYVDNNLTIARSAGGVNPAQYRKLSVYGNANQLYRGVPGLVDVNGSPQIVQVYNAIGSNDPLVLRQYLADWGRSSLGHPHIPYPIRTGPRGQAIMSPYMTWHGHTRKRDDGTIAADPHIPMWVGLLLDGRVYYAMRDGSFAFAGQIPVAADSYTNDFAFYEPDRKLFFVTDSAKGKILKVDRTGPSWVTTELATGFGRATSCRAIGEYIYVADNLSGTVWEIHVQTRAQRFICSIPGVFWIDSTSDGNLFALTTTQSLYRVTVATGAVGPDILAAKFHEEQQWVQVSVDRNGTFGPVDAAYVAIVGGGSGNTTFYRVQPDGTVLDKWGSSGLMSASHAPGLTMDSAGHYPWTSAIHPDDGCLLVQGTAQVMPAIIAVELPGDHPAAYPYIHSVARTGQDMIGYGGTVQGAQPSFTCQINMEGGGFLGVTPDYIASLGYAGAAAFVRAGMIGSVPRTLTNAELWPILYYLFANSQQHLQQGAALITGLKAHLGVV